jgi:hypothetical protein
MELFPDLFDFLIRAGGYRASARATATACQFCGRVDGSLELSVELASDEEGAYADYAPYNNGIPHDDLLWR